MAKPSDEGNPDCLPCLFLQFPVRENGARVYQILQVFSRQAIMMDTLISDLAEESKQCEAADENVNANNRLQDNSICCQTLAVLRISLVNSPLLRSITKDIALVKWVRGSFSKFSHASLSTLKSH